ncbi:hypothetical protein, partial [Aeromonas veronii]|uniref:hypothetical protein n=1 Tax=Aeromonas veronii TaxID=654 RepID=UPI003D1A06AB
EYKITPCSVGQILVPCLKNVRDLALPSMLLLMIVGSFLPFGKLQMQLATISSLRDGIKRRPIC